MANLDTKYPNAARPVDPALASRFVLKVDDVELGAFTEVSGLALSIEVEELVEGGQNHFAHHLLGRITWPHLVFKRGVTDSAALLAWISTFSGAGLHGESYVTKGSPGSIRLNDSQGNEVQSWAFVNAKPVKWTGPTFAAGASDVALEELEVAHGGFST